MTRAERAETADLALERAVARECDPAELDGILLLGLSVYEVEVGSVSEKSRRLSSAIVMNVLPGVTACVGEWRARFQSTADGVLV